MKSVKKIVLPGEVLAASEEFLAGEGTFEQDGKILASCLGKLNLDSEEMVAKVEPINPLVELRVGDVVLARVQDVKSSMVLVNVFRLEGKSRGITGETFGSLHISKISEGFTQDVWKEFRIGDIIRAKVVRDKPALQLSTSHSDLGVLFGLCTKCRMPLIKRDKSLFCENCKRSEIRKMALDYGNYHVIEQ